MNARAHWISVWTGVWLLVTGLSGALPGDPFQPASFTLIFGWLPDPLDGLWPGLFTAAGVLAIVGFWHTRALLASHYMAALAYLTWGLTSLYGWWTDQGGTWPGSSAYFINFGCLIAIALLVTGNRRIEGQVANVQANEDDASDARDVLRDTND